MNEELSTLLGLVYLMDSHCPSTSGATSILLWRTLCMGLPPTIGLTWPASVLVFEGPTSATILANIWVGEDHGDLLAASSPPTASSSTTLGEEGVLPEVAPVGDPSSGPPLVLLSFSPSEKEQQPVSDHGGIFKVAHSLFILMLMASLFWTEALIGEWQKSGAKSHIFWSGRIGSSKRPWGGR